MPFASLPLESTSAAARRSVGRRPTAVSAEDRRTVRFGQLPAAPRRAPAGPAPYEAASRHTGQSEPNISRPGPNSSTAAATYGRRSSTVHAGRIGLGDQAGELGASRSGAAASGATAARHSANPAAPARMRGLPRWSSTNRTCGSARGGPGRRRQLVDPHHEVVRQPGRTDGGEPAAYVRRGRGSRAPPPCTWARMPTRRVAAGQRPVAGEDRRPGRARPGRPTPPRRRSPAWRGRASSSTAASAGSHRPPSTSTVRRTSVPAIARPQVGRGERAPDRGQGRFVEPGVAVPGTPEVVVGVDGHSSAFGPQRRPQVVRRRRCGEGGVAPHLLGRFRADDDRRHRRVRAGERERRGRQRGAVPAARLGDGDGPLDERGRRRAVLVRQAAVRLVDGEQAAVEHAGVEHRDAGRDARRQQVGRGGLLQQRVAARRAAPRRARHSATNRCRNAARSWSRRRSRRPRPRRAARPGPGSPRRSPRRRGPPGRAAARGRPGPGRAGRGSLDSDRRTPSRLKSQTRRCVAGTSKPSVVAVAAAGVDRVEQPAHLGAHRVAVARAARAAPRPAGARTARARSAARCRSSGCRRPRRRRRSRQRPLVVDRVVQVAQQAQPSPSRVRCGVTDACPGRSLIAGRRRRPCMPPSTASTVPVVAPASGLAR